MCSSTIRETAGCNDPIEHLSPKYGVVLTRLKLDTFPTSCKRAAASISRRSNRELFRFNRAARKSATSATRRLCLRI